MDEAESIYTEMGIPTVINGTGTKTRIGGSLIRDEALDAMVNAAQCFVRISDLQAYASELIAEVTGAESGYVTNGAAAGLTMASAACLAGNDFRAMEQLPNTDGISSQIVMARTHRIGYDHAIRLSGASIVDIGTNDESFGTGSTPVEPWELEAAITDETAAVAYMYKPNFLPELETVIDIAHARDVPVIVDAAAELPPKKNLSYFIENEVDLVVYSGGKGIRGPQSTGILAGKRDLIESVALQSLDMHVAWSVWDPPKQLIDKSSYNGVPKQGIGRGMKVGKEELVGIIRALELFLEEDHQKLSKRWSAQVEKITERLEDIPELRTRIEDGDEMRPTPEIIVTVDRSSGHDIVQLVNQLQNSNPRIFVGTDRLNKNGFVINPRCLSDKEADLVVEQIETILQSQDVDS